MLQIILQRLGGEGERREIKWVNVSQVLSLCLVSSRSTRLAGIYEYPLLGHRESEWVGIPGPYSTFSLSR